MNKNAIQKFAIWARNELIAQVSQRAYQYGIDESGFGDASADTIGGRLLTAEEKSQRQELIKQIREKGYKQVMEEVAYTWFNRFIALRFMEVNNYLPSHIRVFSDSTGAFKPEILNDVLHLDLPGLNSGKVAEYIESNDTDNLYRYLLLTQCNALNEALPVMFERMGGYTEMLLPNNILKQDGVLGRMVSDIPEEDWQDAVQIIGWLYQYYNTELKDDTFAQLKKNVKITKERIPAATQLFTPDWIVRYMVENSLGRLWLEHLGAQAEAGTLNIPIGVPIRQEGGTIYVDSATERDTEDNFASYYKENWKYYLEDAKQEPDVAVQLREIRKSYKDLTPKDIKVIDPCMGSGHILVYAFDVLMQIYTAAGWDQREAAQSILKNNLYGLDIDDRAAQLAYFAVMMKARQYDRRLFTRGIQPNIYVIRESNGIQAMTIEYFHQNDPKLKADIERIVTEMRDAKEYGSILNITPVDFAGLYARFDEIREDINMMRQATMDELLPLVKCVELLAQKYDVVVTNPPYMAVSNAGAKVNDYVKKNYPDSKADLFAVFIERCGQMTKKNGYQAMITQHAWMFLSSFEKLRAKLLSVDIVNMAHLGARAFEEIGGEVVQTTSFVIRKSHVADYKGEYCRLIEPTMQQGKEDMFLAGENRYAAAQSNFSKIPGSPLSYWVNDNVFRCFVNGKPFDEVGHPRVGMQTSNNDKFLRLWSEIRFDEFASSSKKWIKYIKGGSFRRWYGNLEYVVWYNGTPSFILQQKNARVLPESELELLKCTWTDLATTRYSCRLAPVDSFHDISGHCFYPDKTTQMTLLAFTNTTVFQLLIDLLNSSLHYQVGDVARIPILTNSEDTIAEIANNSVEKSKDDWDSYETSWDFKRNPLV